MELRHVCTPRRADVEDLNERARAELRQRGLLGADLIYSGGRGFAEGDEVLCLRNDRRLGVLNGTRGVVRGESDGSILIDTEVGRRTLSADYVEAGHVAHGYASTIDKAQGATVDRGFVLGSEACYREAGYVAMSRARAGTERVRRHGSVRRRVTRRTADPVLASSSRPCRVRGQRRSPLSSSVKRRCSTVTVWANWRTSTIWLLERPDVRVAGRPAPHRGRR